MVGGYDSRGRSRDGNRDVKADSMKCNDKVLECASWMGRNSLFIVLNLGNTTSREVDITTDFWHVLDSLVFSILKHRVQGQWSFLLQTTDENLVRSVTLAPFRKKSNLNRS